MTTSTAINPTDRQLTTLANRYRRGETLRDLQDNPPSGLPTGMSLSTITRFLKLGGVRKLRARGTRPA